MMKLKLNGDIPKPEVNKRPVEETSAQEPETQQQKEEVFDLNYTEE